MWTYVYIYTHIYYVYVIYLIYIYYVYVCICNVCQNSLFVCSSGVISSADILSSFAETPASRSSRREKDKHSSAAWNPPIQPVVQRGAQICTCCTSQRWFWHKNWSEISKTSNSACGPAVFSMHSAQGRLFMLALRRPFHCILWFGRASQLVSNSRCCLPETPEKRSRKEKQMVHFPSPALRSCSTVNPASLRSSCDAQAKSLQEKPAVLTKTAKPKREL